MTDRLTALRELLAKVESDACDFDWGFAASPARRAFRLNWLDAMNAFNGSLDAAKALHEAVLPRWTPLIRADFHTHQWHVALRIEDAGVEIGFRTVAAHTPDNPACAWLIAILKALIAQEEGK